MSTPILRDRASMPVPFAPGATPRRRNDSFPLVPLPPAAKPISPQANFVNQLPQQRIWFVSSFCLLRTRANRHPIHCPVRPRVQFSRTGARLHGFSPRPDVRAAPRWKQSHRSQSQSGKPNRLNRKLGSFRHSWRLGTRARPVPAATQRRQLGDRFTEGSQSQFPAKAIL
jgi:hypothetical protein